MSNREISADILKLVGGKENINSVVHCATRLRFKLKDESKAKTEEIKSHPGVIQVVQNAGQYQVVIGSNVSDVHKELMNLAGFTSTTTDDKDDTTKEKQGVVNTLIDVISAIFTPFLGVLAGTGVLKGLLSLLVFFGVLSTDSGVYTILYAAADGFLYYLPVILAYTAAKKFRTNEFIAVAIAMALLHPNVATFNATLDAAGKSLTFFGLPVIYGAGYTSTVIPIIIAVYLQSFVEPFIKKITPKLLRTFGVSLLTLVVMVPLTFIVIGPLGTIIGVVIGKVFQSIYSFSPIVAGLILGALWQIMIIFGMHWGLVPVAIGNLVGTGFDFLLPLVIPGVIAQGGAALAVSLKAKDSKLKGLASSGAITAICGITEPTIYGVNLPLKKPFIAGCIGGAVGGAISAAFGVKIFAFSASIFAIPNYISTIEGVESNAVAGALAILAAFVVAFVMTFVLGIEEKKQ